MNLNNLLIDSDVLEGVIRLPIQLLKPVRRAFSGSVASLPLYLYTHTMGPLCIPPFETNITRFGVLKRHDILSTLDYKWWQYRTLWGVS